MRTGASVHAICFGFLYLLAIIRMSALAIEEPSPPNYNSMLNAMGYDEPMPEKKAYTYVSEYKRLPVYNFGIGKRWVDTSDNKRGREYSFGLGKRTRQYSFGLGKRNDNLDYPARLSLDYFPDSLASHNEDVDFHEEKRGRQPYSFGLGKRAVHSSVGQPIPNNFLAQRYHFGLGKRMPEDEEDTLQ